VIIAGQVRDDLGVPIPNVSVSVVSPVSTLGTTGHYSTVSDSFGNYSVTVPQGKYDLLGLQSGYTEVTIPRLDVSSTPPSTVNNAGTIITVKRNLSSISGTLTDASGSASTIQAFVLQRNTDNTATYAVAVATFTATNSTTAYSVGVAPGTYDSISFSDRNGTANGGSSTSYAQRNDFRIDPTPTTCSSTCPSSYTVPTTGRTENVALPSLGASPSTATCVAATATPTPAVTPVASPTPLATPAQVCSLTVKGSGYFSDTSVPIFVWLVSTSNGATTFFQSTAVAGSGGAGADSFSQQFTFDKPASGTYYIAASQFTQNTGSGSTGSKFLQTGGTNVATIP
jgi:hypothetical protein